MSTGGEVPFESANVGSGGVIQKEPTLTLTIGLLRLTDAAPVIIAKEMGFFADQNIDVRFSIEPSWANVADKLTYQKLDAAVMLPPLVFAVSLGLRGVGAPLIVPMSLSLNGNSITFANDLTAVLKRAEPNAQSPLEIGRRLKTYLLEGKRRIRLATVHTFSTHNLLLRYWLSAVDIDPDTEVDLSVVPPVDMVEALRQGQIAGFCAGAPWGELASGTGAGGTIATSSQLWRNHPEKCLAVRSEWAERYPASLHAMLRALLRAAQFCDDPKNATRVAGILAQRNYLSVDSNMILASLPVDVTHRSTMEPKASRSIFFANAANFPWRSHAAWFLTQMTRWGYLARDVDIRKLASQVYRPDLFREAAMAEGVAAPCLDYKPEGIHDLPWAARGDIADIAMQADTFCDGRIFDIAASVENSPILQSRKA